MGKISTALQRSGNLHFCPLDSQEGQTHLAVAIHFMERYFYVCTMSIFKRVTMKNPEPAEQRVGYIFLLIFLLLTASIFTGSYFAYNNYKKSYRAEIENQLSSIADLKVGQIDGWRKERIGDGQIFYKNAVFSDIVKRYLQNRNDHDAKRAILTWVGQVQSASNYDLMMLLDSQLNTILVYPENKGTSTFSNRSKKHRNIVVREYCFSVAGFHSVTLSRDTRFHPWQCPVL